MSERLVWERHGRDWPNRPASRFVEAAGLGWHVQQMGEGPPVLLLHGTGASTHSWRGLLPLLARRFTVIAPDLPGHGFTAAPRSSRLSLPGMAEAVGELVRVLGTPPTLAVGHSAGAAILARLCLDGAIAPRALVGINAALLPFRGTVSQWFSPLAKMLFLNPFVPHMFAWLASGASVERLIRDTGSTIDAEGLELYRRLFTTPAHVTAALGMMANWDLEPLLAELPKLATRFVLVVGGNDTAVSPQDAAEIKRRVPAVEIVRLKGLGHLAHEEKPAEVARLLERLAEEAVAPAAAP